MNNSGSVNFLFMHHQFEELSHKLDSLIEIAIRIERGQDIDRFSKIETGRDSLINAFSIEDKDDLKQKMIVNALSLLCEGRKEVEMSLYDKLNRLQEVPRNRFIRWWKVFWCKNYFENHRSDFYSILEYLEYYYKAIETIAFAYTVLEQPQLIESLLEENKKIFGHNNIQRLLSQERLFPEQNFDNMWYRKSEEYEKQLIESYKSQDDNKSIIIVLSGNELLEAM